MAALIFVGLEPFVFPFPRSITMGVPVVWRRDSFRQRPGNALKPLPVTDRQGSHHHRAGLKPRDPAQ
jgi:hypothetical protein